MRPGFSLSLSTALGLSLVVLGCSGKSDPAGGETDGDASTGAIDTTPGDDGDGGPAGDGTADGSGSNSDGTSADGTADDTAGGSDGSGTGSMNDPGDPLDCGGTTWACGDGIDNDMDGFTDLDDPECTGPCDDREDSFATGLPGDNMDCKQDCFFDGNSGQGDDGCIWDLRCDPENPGANIGCEYTGSNSCNNQPPNQDAECIEFCSQYVPAGCDCFGCCTVQTAEGSVDIFLNSGEDCSLANLEACLPCTSQIDDCGNPCVPEKCQVCFGETEPPAGCDDPSCPNEMPCNSNADCPTDFYCLQNCCFPPPPG